MGFKIPKLGIVKRIVLAVLDFLRSKAEKIEYSKKPGVSVGGTVSPFLTDRRSSRVVRRKSRTPGDPKDGQEF